MIAEPFVDTNVLVYAHDRDAGRKHLEAKSLVRRLWEEGGKAVISVQVLQELHVNLVRKGVSHRDSAATVRNYLSWRIVDNDKDLFSDGLELQVRWQLSLWDAMIVAAATRAGVAELWTEDLTDGQRFGSIKVVNPLKGM